jgi:hypothetical protein
MIRIKIFEEDSRVIVVPKWWQNFCHGADVGDSIDDVNEKLMDWSASFWISKNTVNSIEYGDRYLDFYDEPAYVWFMLRWA